MSKSKKQNQDNSKEKGKSVDKEKDFDVVEKYNSPILATTAYPSAPPMNPNFSQNTMQKRFTITAE